MELDLCTFYKVLPTERRWQALSWVQKILLFKGINKENSRKHKLISDIIEVLKPWLNTELWSYMQKKDTDTRINTEWGKSSVELDDIRVL